MINTAQVVAVLKKAGMVCAINSRDQRRAGYKVRKVRPSGIVGISFDASTTPLLDSAHARAALGRAGFICEMMVDNQTILVRGELIAGRPEVI